ncbi:SMR family transporter [Hymenobacter sp.]|uniref:DMT family transporter n=1 Tax=Hymenobacter sp. TaxID=1898978 RepID=UPI00286A4EA6|nr:SMR family transporter [Hymenobacter sp.]
MHWRYLLAAALLEVLWAYSLKAHRLQRIREVNWAHAIAQPANLLPLLPLLGYVAFGLGNVALLSLATRQIPTATAYAAWMALAVIGLKLLDVLLLKQPFSWARLFYSGLIIVGVLGLRRLE